MVYIHRAATSAALHATGFHEDDPWHDRQTDSDLEQREVGPVYIDNMSVIGHARDKTNQHLSKEGRLRARALVGGMLWAALGVVLGCEGLAGVGLYLRLTLTAGPFPRTARIELDQ